MPQYLKYPSGRFAAPKRSREIEALFNLKGSGFLVRQEDPLIEEEAQHQKRMSSHWVRPEVENKPFTRRAVKWTIRL